MQYTTEAIVLRRTDYGEADRIVTILTPEYGRLSVLAKGVRKPSSKLAGGIEPLATVQLTIRKGKGELWVLTSSRMHTFFEHIVHDYERLQFAYSVLKKISQAAETLQDAALYELLKTTFISLHNTAIDIRLTEGWFYVHFMALLGHGLNVARDAQGEPLQEMKRYHFSVDDMAFVAHQTGTFRANHLKLLKLFQLKPPVVIAEVGGVEKVIDECVQLLRRLHE